MRPRVTDLWRSILGAGTSNLTDGLSPKVIDRLGALLRIGNPDLRAGISNEELAQSGVRKGGAFSTPFFNPQVYRARAEAAGAALSSGDSPLVHWATVGAELGIVPTTAFQEDAYILANPDVAEAGLAGFEHYLFFGHAEGRQLGRVADGGLSSRLNTRTRAWGGEHRLPEVVPAAFEEALPSLSGRSDFHTRIVAPLQTLAPHFGDEEAAMLVAMFNASAYRILHALGADLSDEACLEHFLTTGLWKDASPTPLFDAEFYTAEALALGIPPPHGFPAYLHWLAVGREYLPTPTVRFDEAFYRFANPDIGGADLDVFEHYIFHGSRDERQPNALFNPGWYAANTIVDASMPVYLDYLVRGITAGAWPSRIVAAHASSTSDDFTLGSFDRGLAAMAALDKSAGCGPAQFALAMFVPDDAAKLGADWDELVDFLIDVEKEGEYSGRLFSPELYRERAKEAGLLVPSGKAAFTHFLQTGRLRRIVPTLAFEESFYLKVHTDLQRSGVWGFEHYLMHGVFEGRRPNRLPPLAMAPALAEPSVPVEAGRWKRQFLTALYAGEPGSEATSMAMRVARVLESPVFAEQMQRALALEPLIGDPSTIDTLLAPPFHDIAASRNAVLTKRFPKTHYDNIVCIPWLRMGGADLVACLLAGALRRLYPNESVLLLQTDHPAQERIDWKPEGVDLIDISDITRSVDGDTAERLIYVALSGLTPKRVINVNSRLCWRVMQRFGKRLSDLTALYSYLFCWDRTPEGVWAGYPSEFYAETAPHIAGILTDTDYLKTQLTRIYSPPANLRDKIYPVYSPLRVVPAPGNAVAERLAKPKGRRPRIVWAARMDRQKRFDLLVEIARSMPEADFSCWGSPLLDAPPDLSALPKNLTVHGSFKTYEQLKLNQADVWLFTAEWEGLPTILIELGARGVAIVGSAVGGVPELLNSKTAWPIEDFENVADYVAALRDAIARPDERLKRAIALQEVVARRHSSAAYDASLKAVFEGASNA